VCFFLFVLFPEGVPSPSGARTLPCPNLVISLFPYRSPTIIVVIGIPSCSPSDRTTVPSRSRPHASFSFASPSFAETSDLFSFSTSTFREIGAFLSFHSRTGEPTGSPKEDAKLIASTQRSARSWKGRSRRDEGKRARARGRGRRGSDRRSRFESEGSASRGQLAGIPERINWTKDIRENRGIPWFFHFRDASLGGFTTATTPALLSHPSLLEINIGTPPSFSIAARTRLILIRAILGIFLEHADGRRQGV